MTATAVKGVEELVALFDQGLGPGFLSIVIALLFFGTVYALEHFETARVLRPWIRKLISDYAYPIATLFWTGFSHIPGRLKRTNILKLPTTPAFHPSSRDGWVIPFWNLDVGWVFVALPLGFLTMLLFWYDHNISSITAQARNFPLKKPGGFHWDFFLLGCTTFVAGVIGLPFPNGLVPQAPVHTDSLTTYETRVMKLEYREDESEEQYARKEENRADAVVIEHPQPVRVAVDVREQRISHFIMCLGLFGMMSGPLLVVLSTVPRALFAGVFFHVGVRSFSKHCGLDHC